MRKSCPSWGSKLKNLNFPSFALSIKQPPRSGMSSAGYPKLNASVCQNWCIGCKRILSPHSFLLISHHWGVTSQCSFINLLIGRVTKTSTACQQLTRIFYKSGNFLRGKSRCCKSFHFFWLCIDVCKIWIPPHKFFSISFCLLCSLFVSCGHCTA